MPESTPSLITDLTPGTGPSEHAGPHAFGHEITVEAWFHCDDNRPEGMQSLVSKWRPRGTLDEDCFDGYDAGRTDQLDTRGYYGAVFDGRYIYFAQELQPRGQHGNALRLDTHGDFKDPSSYEAFDASNIDGLETIGYYGAIFDGRFVYYVPRKTSFADSNLLRFDTHGEFKNADSWSAYNFESLQTFQNAAFDGQYIYLCPGYRERDDDDDRRSGRVVRYNTRGELKSQTSYETFDAEHVDGFNVGNFDGGACDGRYVYFVPLTNRVTLRYDTQAGFDNQGSWAAFDASSLGMGMCVGSVFDGRHIYWVPYENGIQIRFDTEGNFRDPASWSRFDASHIYGLKTVGFDGGMFDGRFIHFIPFVSENKTFHSNWLRYDTQKEFDNPDAWHARDVSSTDGLKTQGYNGGAFDGRYLYCAPWRSELGEPGERETWEIHGRILRYDSIGASGTFSLRYGHNGGLTAAAPGPTFLVNTSRGALSVSMHGMPTPGSHHLAGTYDGDSIKLYLDGNLTVQRSGAGELIANEIPIVTGQINDGLGQFRGSIERIRVFSTARSEEAIRSNTSL
jgi:hypothetical protein